MNIRYPIYEGVYRILTFWLTEFTHLGGNGNPTRSNLVLVAKAARDRDFNLDELKQLNNMKLKDILK